MPAPSRSTLGGVNFRADLDPGDLNRLMRQIRAFDGNLSRELRAHWRRAVAPMKSDMLRTVGRSAHVSKVVRTLRVTTTNRKRGMDGLTVAVNWSRLSNADKALARGWENGSWRHPVFGYGARPWKTRGGKGAPWRKQTGTPWFAPAVQRHTPRIKAETDAALRAAVRRIEGI